MRDKLASESLHRRAAQEEELARKHEMDQRRIISAHSKTRDH